jgi:hypothetical protein
MAEVKYKLKPGVMCVPSKKGILEDHNTEYPQSYWEEEEAEEKVKEGYLVRVREKVKA